MLADVPMVCVLGAGPAGLSAALWLHNFGLRVTVLEKSAQAGGMQRLNFLSNDWVLGKPGLSGPQLAADFVSHIASHPEIDLRFDSPVERITRLDAGFGLTLRGGASLRCKTILLATGTRFRGEETVAGVEGFEACREVFDFGPHAFREMDRLRDQRILIIGGGDNAFENARFMLDRGCEVMIAARSRIRAQRVLRASVEAHPRCQIVCPLQLEAVSRVAGAGVSARLRDAAGHSLHYAADRIHVLAGYQPNSGFLSECLAPEIFASLRFDAEGYLLADSFGRTGCEGIYAAGDVCNPVHPCVVSALAQGAEAARGMEIDLRDIG